MLTGLFRRRTYCAAANGTRLSANRPAHGMNSMSSNWGTSGGQPVSSNSGRPATQAGWRATGGLYRTPLVLDTAAEPL